MTRIPSFVLLLTLSLPVAAAAEPEAPEVTLGRYFEAVERDGPAAGGRFLDEPSLVEFRHFHLRVFRVSAKYQQSTASRLMGGASYAELEQLPLLPFYERVMRTVAELDGTLPRERARILGTVREGADTAHAVVRWRRERQGKPAMERVGVVTLARADGRWLVHTSGSASSALLEFLLEHEEFDLPLVTPPPASAPAAASRPRP